MASVQEPIVVTEPVKEPLSLAEAKDHLNELESEHDSKINGLIKAARLEAERQTGRALINQTLQVALDKFSQVIELPMPPLKSVESITYVDPDGNTQTLGVSVYRVDIKSTPGRVTLADGQSWPDILPVASSIVIEFIAGYGNEGGDVPESIRQGMRLYLTKHYDLDARVGAYLDQAIKSSFNQKKVYGI
ncbi:MAG: phage head-tail connector protein [Candidatus Thiodiazotropha sp. (ex Ctena orbiculata)]|nr:phage head-tail connector protein [Candidatus Thiodiazotropha taylori]